MAKRKEIINIYTSEAHQEAFSWCLKQNIKIYPKVAQNGFKLIIDNNGEIIQSPKIYDKIEVEVKSWDLYLYFYKKYFK